MCVCSDSAGCKRNTTNGTSWTVDRHKLVPVYKVGKASYLSCVCSESIIYKACEVRKYRIYSS